MTDIPSPQPAPALPPGVPSLADLRERFAGIPDHSGKGAATPSPAEGGDVQVPLAVLEDASRAIGRFVSDEGWTDSDMQAMDNLDAYIARHKANAAASKVQPKGPVFLARDVAELLGIGVPELSTALVALGFPQRSQGMAVDPLEALAVCRARAAQAPAPAPERAAWVPYLSDRADGVAGHYAIARWNPAGYREVWNLRSHRWASASDDVMSLEEADSLLRQIVIPTVKPAPVAQTFTEGHCAEKRKPGGCQLHNLHCGYPACDRKAATSAPAVGAEQIPAGHNRPPNGEPCNADGKATPAGQWTVSIAGPDDVHRFDSELDALRFANQVNRTYLADLLAHPGDEVLCLATVSDVSPALPTSPLRNTGVETRLPSHERLNLLGRWFEGRGMESMARICRTAAAELKAAWAPWQPIETAPVGRVHSPPLRVIVAEVLDDGTPYVGEAWFEQERGKWWAANMDGSDAPGSTIHPTHWVPLPAAPAFKPPVHPMGEQP